MKRRRFQLLLLRPSSSFFFFVPWRIPWRTRINGRIAGLGLMTLLLVELATGKSVLNYHSPSVVLILIYFVVRLRASIKPFLHGRYFEISTISKRILQDRFNDGKQILNSLRLSGNGGGIKLFNRGFHSSPQCCYISESNAEMNMIMKILTERPELEKSELSQKTKSKKKKKKKDEQVFDSVSKPKLLTEKPEVPWNLNGKRKKTEAHASSPSRDVTDSNVSLSPSQMLSGVNEDTVVPEAEGTCKDQMGMRISSYSEELEKHLEMQRILGKDLEVLLHSVMHMENHPNGGSR